ncbi:DUF2905 domain-containing protein [Aquisalinus flavus]|uniref:DUF2905 domain-containing protein n=1 Tax=Aquisalinus flavus TaxID=1526572 RepID=A0A8J2V1B5_9PROT|nr:DUF2905 domain-containing protein [Aquisalinus flavus]MBD0426794.1 DUF2905 domain-containing protein [Aquisalinus flavus]UNE46645.1 DUF2905 domain-containing protein [Aquisalinus flavus]GGC96063.1 hypothetical protein GCM10011342_01060 [Aquisalinus flavus]
MQKLLIIAGIVLVLAGLLWPWLSRLGLGRLPGDIVFRGENTQVYFPIVTCLILSALLSFAFWLFNR